MFHFHNTKKKHLLNTSSTVLHYKLYLLCFYYFIYYTFSDIPVRLPDPPHWNKCFNSPSPKTINQFPTKFCSVFVDYRFAFVRLFSQCLWNSHVRFCMCWCVVGWLVVCPKINISKSELLWWLAQSRWQPVADDGLCWRLQKRSDTSLCHLSCTPMVLYMMALVVVFAKRFSEQPRAHIHFGAPVEEVVVGNSLVVVVVVVVVLGA